jgi:hypothetical protein
MENRLPIAYRLLEERRLSVGNNGTTSLGQDKNIGLLPNPLGDSPEAKQLHT